MLYGLGNSGINGLKHSPSPRVFSSDLLLDLINSILELLVAHITIECCG